MVRVQVRAVKGEAELTAQGRLLTLTLTALVVMPAVVGSLMPRVSTEPESDREVT